MAVSLEDRYKGLRAPHKIKMAVSGCLRECAEAQGKDLGLIATSHGYNMYVCGNGGARPKHAALLATDIDEETCLKYSDRFLMFYVSTAKHLQRTAPWLEELPGGIQYLKQVVIEDSLGICAELEKLMADNVANYKCEWKEVVYDEELQKKFQQFVNTKENVSSEQIEYIDMRKQRHPNTYDCPDISGPALFTTETAPDSWEWGFLQEKFVSTQLMAVSLCCMELKLRSSTCQSARTLHAGLPRRTLAPSSRRHASPED